MSSGFSAQAENFHASCSPARVCNVVAKDAADVAAAIHPVLPVPDGVEHLFDAEFAEGFTLLAG